MRANLVHFTMIYANTYAYTQITQQPGVSQTKPGYVARCPGLGGLRLFVDPAVVEAASPAELLNLCRSLAACLAALDDLARQQLRQTALPLLMRGSMDWLDSGPFRRDLGKIYVQLIQAASTRAVDPYPHRSAFIGKMENYNRKITRNWYRYRINCN